MNVTVTSFSSPFSFYCIPKTLTEGEDTGLTHINKLELKQSVKTEELQHGQYVAVMWGNKWVRGLIDMKENLLIWLIDHGIYFRPSESTIYFNLPLERKKLPSRVFEASIHGVVPTEKSVDDIMESIKIELTSAWNQGATTRARELIKSAKQIHFNPVALLSLEYNDVIIGDLYISIPDKGTVNLADKLAEWPIFLKKDAELYLKNITKLYKSRKLHRACRVQAKVFDGLPTLKADSTLLHYNNISKTVVDSSSSLSSSVEDSDDDADGTIENGKQVQMSSSQHMNDDGSTTVVGNGIRRDTVKLTDEEKQRYAAMTIDVNGEKLNALFVLQNKIRDLNMCEKYKKYEGRSFGRGFTKRK